MKKLIILFLLAFSFVNAQIELDGGIKKVPSLWKLSGTNVSPVSSWNLLPFSTGVGNLGASGTIWNYGYFDTTVTNHLANTTWTLNSVAVTTTGTQLNYLAGATGTTGTTTTNLVFSTSPVLVTPTLGVAIGTSLALGGATIGTNALAVTGNTLLTGNLIFGLGTREIVTSTSDGDDTGELTLSGGGTFSSARGAGFKFYGNEVPTIGGTALFIAGNVSTGAIRFSTQGLVRLRLEYDGSIGYYTGAGSSATDSSIVFNSTSGSPRLNFYGTDGDTWNIGINTSDQATFNGAGGGYVFDGQISAPVGSNAAPSYSFTGELGTGIYKPSSNTLGFSLNGAKAFTMDTGGFTINNVGYAYGISSDLYMWRGAAGQWEMGYSTNPYELRVSNTSDGVTYPSSGTNRELAIFGFKTTANVLTIGAVANGSGTVRPVNIVGSAFNFKNGVNPITQTLWSKDATGTNDRYTTIGWGTGADSLKYSIAETHNGDSGQGAFYATGFSSYNFDANVVATSGIVIGTNGGEIDSAKVVDGNLDAFVGGTAYTALNTAYGDAYIVGTSPQTINITVDSTYFTVKTLTSGAVLKNVTVQDSSLTVGVAGVYSIEYNISFSTTNFAAGNTIRGYVFVDDVQSDKTGFRRFVSGTNDTGSASGSGILSLTANQVVKLKVEGLDDGDDGEIIVHNANISVKRID